MMIVPLTTIDGVLCCPFDEFQNLCCYMVAQDYAITNGPKYTSVHRADSELGARTRHYHEASGVTPYSPLVYVPDEWFVREIAKGVRAQAFSRTHAKIGEETINGKVWTGEESGGSLKSLADKSLTGPASLGGKIVRELCYRLYVEAQKDKRAQRYAPHEQLDQRVLQPDPPAENK